MFALPAMKALLRDTRIQRLLLANLTGSIGSGVTIFAVPWLLVQQPGGSATYGFVTLVTTIVLFCFMPYYGVWVDRHSRKTMLLGSELFGFTAMGLLALAATFAGQGAGILAAVYFCGMLYYTLHYPAKFAFLQQVFDKSQYQSLMGLIEIQGQTAMMIAGGLGVLLVEHVSLPTILLFDTATYLCSFAIQSTIPYRATHLESGAAPAPASAWRAIGEGWQWLRERPQLAVFFAASLTPFICIMVGNYLFPIYVVQTLHAGAWVLGVGEIIFALGAILAGASLPRLISAYSAQRTVPFTMVLFAGGLLLAVVAPFVPLYLLGALLLGYGNAGSRVARGAAILHLVDNRVMGRVGSFYHAYDRVLRTVLTTVMIPLVATHGAQAAFALLLAVLLLGLVAVLRTRTAMAAQ